MRDAYIVHAFCATPTRVYPLADDDGSTSSPSSISSTSSISSVSVTLATASKHHEAWSRVHLWRLEGSKL
jgi:hypothetical protein